MKTLVIAEKPSVARDIARVLGCAKKENGALEGNQYIVTWALGHEEDHDDSYQRKLFFENKELGIVHIY